MTRRPPLLFVLLLLLGLVPAAAQLAPIVKLVHSDRRRLAARE